MKNILRYFYFIIISFLLFLNNSCKKAASVLEEHQFSPCTTCPLYYIGENFQGGKIAYILQSGDPGYDPTVIHGIIAAADDQSIGAVWGCDGTQIIGADNATIGTGNQNTIDIMAGCVTAGIAARRSGDLVFGGYNDWYLPSKDELNKLYLSKTSIGNFANQNYWSSSESSNGNAWSQNFSNGIQGDSMKAKFYYVRSVRSF